MINLSSSKLLCLILIISVLILSACSPKDKSASTQISYQASVGCLVMNDLYAAYFSAYLKPINNDISENEQGLFKSYCKNLPRTGMTYFAIDLIDEDIKDIPISIRLVEQAFIEENKNTAEQFQDIRTLSVIPAKLYPQGLVGTQIELTEIGYYMLYLTIGDNHSISEENTLKIPFNVGIGTNKKSLWSHFLSTLKIILIIIFPILMIGLILLPILPENHWTKVATHFYK